MAAHPGSWRVRPIRLLIVLLVTAAGLAGCTGGGDRDRGQASISVSPLAALVDQPVAVTVQGLPAGTRTTLTARARDTDGITWSATAQFTATSAGEVSLGQRSVGGSYGSLTDDALTSDGGTVAATQAAQADAHAKLLALLAEQ